MALKFLLFTFIIYFFLFSGYITRRIRKKLESVSDVIIKYNIIINSSAIMIITFWVLDLRNLKSILFLPFSAILISLNALFFGRIISGIFGHNKYQRGAFLSCCMFSNIGITLGSFLCFVFLGEPGLSYALMYVAHFYPFFFTFGFYLARHYNDSYDSSWIGNFKDYLTNPVRYIPTIAIIIGLTLNIMNIERPAVLKILNTALLVISIILFSFCIGLTLRFKKVFNYIREIAGISLIKFVINPLFALLLIILAGGSDSLGELPPKVLFIEAIMPVAIFALVLSKLFEFDQDMANSSWIATTMFIILIIPVIYLLLHNLPL